MGSYTKESLNTALLRVLQEAVEPVPDWQAVNEAADRFADALQAHMEDEFIEGATPTPTGEEADDG